MAQPLTFRRRLGYGAGDFAFNLFFTTASLYLLYYYTDVLGLSPAVAGWVFAAALMWDALFDPFMGYLANRTRTRWGRYRPYLLFGAAPLALSWVLIFLPVKFEGLALIVFAAAAHVLFRTLYAVVSMPYLALSAVMTSDSAERGVLAGFRMVSAATCGLLAAFFTLQLVTWFGGGQTGFFWTAVLYGALATLVFLVVFANTHEAAAVDTDAPPPTPREMLHMLGRNRAFWIVCGATLIGSVGGTLFNKTVPYWFKYTLGREDLIGPALTALTAAVTLSIFFWSFLMKRTAKRNVWLSGSGLVLLAYGLLWFAPETPAAYIPLLALLGFGAGAGYLSFWAMMPDTVEYGEWRSGVRAEGAIFGLVSLVQKASLGLAAGVLGELLGGVGYRANQAQTPETLAGMKLIMIALPAGFALVAIACIAFYPLDQKTHGRLVRVLDRRRARRLDALTTPEVSL
jgi:GPH family glycoside/pentoside/hexuronide:cation symporter